MDACPLWNKLSAMLKMHAVQLHAPDAAADRPSCCHKLVLCAAQWGVVILASDSATGTPEPQQKLATQLNISLFLLAHGASLEEPMVHRLPSQAYTIDTGPCEMKVGPLTPDALRPG